MASSVEIAFWRAVTFAFPQMQENRERREQHEETSKDREAPGREAEHNWFFRRSGSGG
jgi:hypothetical protein